MRIYGTWWNDIYLLSILKDGKLWKYVKKILFIIAILFVTIVKTILTLSLSPCLSTSGDIARQQAVKLELFV